MRFAALPGFWWVLHMSEKFSTINSKQTNKQMKWEWKKNSQTTRLNKWYVCERFFFTACFGSWGINCTQNCTPGHYGFGCRSRCFCHSNQLCDKRLGCMEKGKFLLENFFVNRNQKKGSWIRTVMHIQKVVHILMPIALHVILNVSMIDWFILFYVSFENISLLYGCTLNR